MKKLHRKNLHRLLLYGLTAEEVRALCQNHFWEVYVRLTLSLTAMQQIEQLMSYCIRQAKADELLGLLQEQYPSKYEEYGPYYTD